MKIIDNVGYYYHIGEVSHNLRSPTIFDFMKGNGRELLIRKLKIMGY